MWTDSYRTWIGQEYDEDGGFPSFSGMYLSDNYVMEFQWYGDTVMSMKNGGFAVGNNYNNSDGQYVEIHKARGTDPVLNGDDIGGLGFWGRDASGGGWDEFQYVDTFSVLDALIQVSVEAGTIDATLPTKMTFHTTSATGSMTEKMVLDGDGNLGIGDTNPSVALDVVGDINYTGVIQDVSDRRLKENLAPLENSLEGLRSLDGYSFTMKGDEAGTVEYGLIAQEVERVFPELVTTGDDGYMAMNYIGLIAPMVEAMKDQQTQIEALKARIEALEQ